MARNAIKSEFRTSKMSAGGHFVKKNENKIKFKQHPRVTKIIISAIYLHHVGK